MTKRENDSKKDEAKPSTEPAPAVRPTMTHQTTTGGVSIVGAAGATEHPKGGTNGGPSDT